MPTLNDEVLNVAEPALSVPVPNVVVPSLNVTVPADVPAAGDAAVTVAVNVTDWPELDGFAELATVVVLFPLLTVCVRAEEVLVEKFVSPP